MDCYLAHFLQKQNLPLEIVQIIFEIVKEKEKRKITIHRWHTAFKIHSIGWYWQERVMHTLYAENGKGRIEDLLSFQNDF
jgi:hypothetical protein